MVPQVPEPLVRRHQPFHAAPALLVRGRGPARKHQFEHPQQLLGDLQIRLIAGLVKGNKDLVREPTCVARRCGGGSFSGRDLVRFCPHRPRDPAGRGNLSTSGQNTQVEKQPFRKQHCAKPPFLLATAMLPNPGRNAKRSCCSPRLWSRFFAPGPNHGHVRRRNRRPQSAASGSATGRGASSNASSQVPIVEALLYSVARFSKKFACSTAFSISSSQGSGFFPAP